MGTPRKKVPIIKRPRGKSKRPVICVDLGRNLKLLDWCVKRIKSRADQPGLISRSSVLRHAITVLATEIAQQPPDTSDPK